MRLRRLLVLGLVLILFVSLCTSALGVFALVRNYLWHTSEQETLTVSRGVTRYLENRNQSSIDSPRRQARPFNRSLRRFNRGPGRLLLIKSDQIVLSDDDDSLPDWTAVLPTLRAGFQVVSVDDELWQVYLQPVNSVVADRFLIIRPWSPVVKLLRNLVLFQVVISLGVMIVAVAVARYFASRLAKPLEELRDRTKSIGETSVHDLQTSKVLEIEALQTAFVEMSERVDEAMSSQRRFVADASHELKTPLTAILGMLELLQKNVNMEPKDREQALSVARKEAGRMQSLIADLLLLSRARANRSGTKSVVDLVSTVHSEVSTLSLLFPDSEFSIQGVPTLPYKIHPEAFSRIIRNLLENAVHYGGSQSIEIFLGESEQEVTISVRDRGPGIAEDKLQHLFERFYRTDSGRARIAGGHGLGLAIVKALVEEAGGVITCQNREPHGCDFTIVFDKR